MERLFKNYSLTCIILAIYTLLIGITGDLNYIFDLIFLGLFLFSVYADMKDKKIARNNVNIVILAIPIVIMMISYLFHFNLDIFINMGTNFIVLLFLMSIKFNEEEYQFFNGILVSLLIVYVLVSLYGFSINLSFETLPFINGSGWLYYLGLILFIIVNTFKLINALFLGYKVNKRCDTLMIVTASFLTLGFIQNVYYNCSSFIIAMGLLVSYFNTLKTKKVLFICSSGGHLDELLQLKPLFDKYEYHIVTEMENSTKSLVKKYPKKVDYLLYGTRFRIWSYIPKFAFNCLKTIYLYYKIKPTIVITTGAHTAVPMCYYAKLNGAKIIFIESFANLTTRTLSGRLVYPIADKFIVQWPSTKKLYPKAILGGSIY